MLRSIALATAITIAAALPSAAQVVETTTVIHAGAPAPAAGCPAEPPHALAVAFASGLYRTDLQQAALAAVSGAAQRAGLALVAPQANALQSIPGATMFTPIPTVTPPPGAPQPAGLCVPTLVLTAAFGSWSMFTLLVTRYSEPVAVGAVLALPDGRIVQATSQQAATWYSGSLPTPYIPGVPVYGLPVGTPQTGAEQDAVRRGTAAVLTTLLPNVATVVAPGSTAVPRIGRFADGPQPAQ